jgi:hypothetical protein
MMIKKVLLVLLMSMSFMLSAQPLVNHWETIVLASDTWKYFPGTIDPGASWKSTSFNDTGWQSGAGGFGYGDNDDGTVISATLSVFIRKKFTITNINQIEKITLHVDHDDGFVAYVNGVEVARNNMGTSTTIAYNAPSVGSHEAMLFRNGIPESYTFTKSQFSAWLVQGENTLAVEVHNESITSSDMSAAVFLSAGLNTTNIVYRPVPSWFPQDFTSSNLPIIVINTNGRQIVNEPQIVADMGIIDNGSGKRNAITDILNVYDGKITIEIRGQSSQMFPKKSFRIETQDAQGNNLNMALLGMPPDNDWVLYAPYTDKTMLRDVLTFKLGRDLGHYTPRTRYTELVVNGEYRGVYVLIEKIKRDKNRVNISPLTPEDIAGDDLTGGYILRVDKTDPVDYPQWTSVPTPKLADEDDINFHYLDPEGGELVAVQQNYIKNFIKQFGSALSSTNFATSGSYKEFIDVPSFIDFMLVNEIGKNVDAYQFSTYMHKDKNSKNSLLHMGPLWDFNLAYGNVNYRTNSQFAPGWIYNDDYRMYWFRRLMKDPDFSGKMKCRWKELREGFLTNSYFNSAIDSIGAVLNEAQQRNYKRWPILGVYVWPNQYVGSTYQDELNWMKQWILTRLTWMDSNMPGTCIPPPPTNPVTGIDPEYKQYGISVFPNPSKGAFTIRSEKLLPAGTRIIIYNVLGENVFESPMRQELYINTENKKNRITSGLYLIKFTNNEKVFGVQKVVID